MQLKKGQKATITIPSHLGYGKKPFGNIPADSNLIFDVEVLDFETDDQNIDGWTAIKGLKTTYKSVKPGKGDDVVKI